MAPTDAGDPCSSVLRCVLRHPIQCAAGMIVVLLNSMAWVLWIYIPEGRVQQSPDVTSFRGFEGRKNAAGLGSDMPPRPAADGRVESLTRQVQLLQARLSMVEGRTNSMQQAPPRDESSSALLQSQLSSLSAQVAGLAGMLAHSPANQEATTTTAPEEHKGPLLSLEKLQKDLNRVAKQTTDRFSVVFDRLPPAKPVPRDPARTAQGHVCRSPPCSRDLSSCKAYGNCCVDRMYEMLLDFSEFLTKKQVTHFVVSGTLLGAIREQDIIPFTSDLDMVVPAKFWDIAKEINDIVSPRGYYFMQDPQDPHCARLCSVWAGYPLNRDNFVNHFDWDTEQLGADLGYYMDIYDEDMVPYNMLYHMHYPLSQVRIRDHLFPAPREQELWVEASYGPDWRTPDETQHAGEGSYPTDAEAEAYSKGVLLLRRSARDAKLAQKLISGATVDHKTGQISLGSEQYSERPAPVTIRKLELKIGAASKGGSTVNSGTLFVTLPGNKELGFTPVENVVVVWATETIDRWSLQVKQEGIVIVDAPVRPEGKDPFKAGDPLNMEIQLEKGLAIPEKATHVAAWSRNSVGTSALVAVRISTDSDAALNLEDRDFAIAMEFALMAELLPSPPEGLAECLLKQPPALTKKPFDDILLKMVAKNAVAMSQAIADLGRYMKPFVDAAKVCKAQLNIDSAPTNQHDEEEPGGPTSLAVWEVFEKALASLESESIAYKPESDLVVNGFGIFTELDAMVASCVDDHRKLMTYSPDTVGGLLGTLLSALAGLNPLDRLDGIYSGEGMLDWMD